MGEARLKVAARIESLERENQALRDALFGILRQLGRVRVDKAIANGVGQGDSMDVQELRDAWVFTFKPSNMVVPGGVRNGAA